MARRDEPLTAGFAVLAVPVLIAAVALAGLGGAALADPGGFARAFDRRLVDVVAFTLMQAGLSTLVSVVPGVVLALALNRWPGFPGRGAILRLFAAPLALPAISGALGVLAVYGRTGPVAWLVELAGAGPWPGPYGLGGILLAHAFFNVPLAARLALGALSSIPAERYRLAAQLGFAERHHLAIVEWPALRPSLPGIALLVFLLCATSFAIVLLLGGGPGATTIEVAIYESLRFDFDPGRTLALVGVQFALTATLALFAAAPAIRAGSAALGQRRPPRGASRGLRVFDAAIIGFGFMFVAAPLAGVAWRGAAADAMRLAVDPAVRQALLTSLGIGAAAALMATVMAFFYAGTGRTLSDRGDGRARLFDSGATLMLALPPTALAAGWFLAINPVADPSRLAPVAVIAINAVMALPFALRVLKPAHDRARDDHDRLCTALGIRGVNRFRIVDWPALRRPLASAFAFAMALSLGDLGVIALFGADHARTLPYLVLQRMGAYRTSDAAGLALLIALMCLLLMALSDRLATEKPA